MPEIINKLKNVCIMVILLLLPAITSAENIVELNGAADKYPINQDVYAFEDIGGKMSISEISSSEISKRFRRNVKTPINFGSTTSAIWMRVTVDNKSLKYMEWLLEFDVTYLEDIQFYYPRPDGNYDVKRLTNATPMKEREISSRLQTFILPVSKDEAKTFYLRVRSNDATTFNLFVLTKDRMMKDDYLEQYGLGLYYGIFLVMILYNLFIWLTLRDRSYIYYVLYFVSVVMIQSYIDGILYGLPWEEFTGMGLRGEIIFFNLMIIFGLLYARNFLQVWTYSPILNKIILGFICISLLFLINCFVMEDTHRLFNIILPLGMLFSPFMMIIGIISYIKGYKPAKYFLLASILFLLGMFARLFADLNLLSWNFFIVHGIKIGSAFDVTILSIALADRFNLMQKELIDHIEYRRKTEAELARSQRIESIALLGGGIAHDLSNILTGLFIRIQLIQKKISEDHSIYRYLKDTGQTFQLAKGILNRFQTFSKSDTSRILPLSIERLINETSGFVLSGSNSKYESIILHKLWTVEGDRTQLTQAITNLVINADQAMPDGGTINLIAENIELSDNVIPNLSKGRYVKITVRDNGSGISEENLSKIFDPFFTTKETGHGLGLASTYTIIQRHKGLITVKSKVGAGTDFMIYLPACDEEVIEAADTEVSTEPSSGARVLMMDDNEVVLESIPAALEEHGYTVETVRNGYEALEAYKSAKAEGRPFDLVILDVIIPNSLSGISVIKMLQAYDPKVRAIVSSGYSEMNVMSNFRQYGFVAALPKPYTIEELIHILGVSQRT